MIDTLTQLRHSEDRQGPWKLYVYESGGRYHSRGIWFRRGPAKYPDEELGYAAAKAKCANAGRNGREVRICDGGDMLVFHAIGTRILFGENFWSDLDKTI